MKLRDIVNVPFSALIPKLPAGNKCLFPTLTRKEISSSYFNLTTDCVIGLAS